MSAARVVGDGHLQLQVGDARDGNLAGLGVSLAPDPRRLPQQLAVAVHRKLHRCMVGRRRVVDRDGRLELAELLVELVGGDDWGGEKKVGEKQPKATRGSPLILMIGG